MARADRRQMASVNHGNPGVAAMDSVNGRRFNNRGNVADLTNNAAGARPNAAARHNLPSRPSAPNRLARAVPAPNAAKPAPRMRPQTNQPQDHVSSSTPAVRHNAPAAHRGPSEAARQRQNPPPQRSAPATRNQPRSLAAAPKSGAGRPAPAPHQQAARQPSVPAGHANREKRGM